MSEKKLSSLVTFNEAEYNNYQKSLASKKEWPGITVNITKGTVKSKVFLILTFIYKFQLLVTFSLLLKFVIPDSRMTLNTPMLIMELYRLVPYKEGRYIHFHPFNMPYIKIRKIELVGIVTNIKNSASNLFLTSKKKDKHEK